MQKTFSVDQLVTVNRPESLYHGQVARIAGLFVSEGQQAARIILPGYIERKVLLSQLEPYTPSESVQVEKLPRPTYTPALPAWAHPGTIMKRGDSLQPGDTLYFSKIANPRRLERQLQPGHWKTTVIVNGYGYTRRIPSQVAEVDLGSWYVCRERVGV